MLGPSLHMQKKLEYPLWDYYRLQTEKNLTSFVFVRFSYQNVGHFVQGFCNLLILHLLRISFYLSESQRIPGCNSMADLSSDSFTILGLWVLGLAVSNINESQLQTYESKTLFLMTSLQYDCIPGLAGTR